MPGYGLRYPNKETEGNKGTESTNLVCYNLAVTEIYDRFLCRCTLVPFLTATCTLALTAQIRQISRVGLPINTLGPNFMNWRGC